MAGVDELDSHLSNSKFRNRPQFGLMFEIKQTRQSRTVDSRDWFYFSAAPIVPDLEQVGALLWLSSISWFPAIFFCSESEDLRFDPAGTSIAQD